MYILVWEYRVKMEAAPEFVRVYGPEGDWAQLFSRAGGYLGTELCVDETVPLRYLTIDRWVSREHFDNFKRQWKREYETLDSRCEALTGEEKLIGCFDRLE